MKFEVIAFDREGRHLRDLRPPPRRVKKMNYLDLITIIVTQDQKVIDLREGRFLASSGNEILYRYQGRECRAHPADVFTDYHLALKEYFHRRSYHEGLINKIL